MSSRAGPRRRGIIVPVIFVIVAVAVFAVLGTWQIERKAWKEGLIADLNAKLSTQPVALPPRDQWPRLSAAADEFRRVTFPAELLDQEALVYTSGSSIRPDVSGPGYWVLSPARLGDGSLIIVNRGFVPEGKQDPSTRRGGQPHGITEIVGAMRWPEPRGMFTPADQPAKNLWFVRDPMAIAAAQGWSAVAPFYIDQEAPPAPGGIPKVGPLKPSFPNNHLQYAVTWYGLAIVTLISGILFLRTRRREFDE
jgi:surfeit locus 1 family protein